MFINCPFCKALVATNPATDEPPEHCPRCAAKLRGVAADVPVPAVSAAPHDEQAAVPALDPDFLLQVPPPDAPVIQGLGTAAPSELSSQIHQTVALETSTPASPHQAAIAPIAAMLKPAEADPASTQADDARHGAKTVAPAPEPAPAATPPERPSPAATPVDGGDAQAPVDATGASAKDPPPAAAPDTPAIADAAACGPSEADPEPAAPVEPAPAPAPASADVDTATAAAGTPTSAAPAAQPAARTLPSFARRRAALGASGLHWKPVAAIVALAMLLALQLLLADRDRLAGDARWRPLLANVCGVLGCALPPWHEPEAFALLARDVRPHPSRPDVLRVTATFRNDARWPQPWPRVRLTLSDVNGNAVATRDFEARDYLGNAPTQAELRSGQSASIAMDIVEAGPRSVAFDFDLL